MSRRSRRACRAAWRRPASAAFRSTRALCRQATCSSPSKAKTATAMIMSPRLSLKAPRPASSMKPTPMPLKGLGPLYHRARRSAGPGAPRRAARARTKARIVAVTGSVGKTGTKEALRLVLDEQGATHASVASYNNHWGVPLTLARMPKDADFGVFEIGMNHAGEITPLVALVKPHVCDRHDGRAGTSRGFRIGRRDRRRQGGDFLRARAGRHRHHPSRHPAI